MIERRKRQKAPVTEYSELQKPQLLNLNIPIIFDGLPNNILIKSSFSDFYMRFDMNCLDGIYMDIQRYQISDIEFVDYENILVQITSENITHSVSSSGDMYKIIKTNHLDKSLSSLVIIDLQYK